MGITGLNARFGSYLRGTGIGVRVDHQLQRVTVRLADVLKFPGKIPNNHLDDILAARNGDKAAIRRLQNMPVTPFLDHMRHCLAMLMDMPEFQKTETSQQDQLVTVSMAKQLIDLVGERVQDPDNALGIAMNFQSVVQKLIENRVAGQTFVYPERLDIENIGVFATKGYFTKDCSDSFKEKLRAVLAVVDQYNFPATAAR
jgi:hypothetical protein